MPNAVETDRARLPGRRTRRPRRVSGPAPGGSRVGRRLRAIPLLLLLPLAGCHHAMSVTNPGEPLRPCPRTPNCVSTEATGSRHAIPPLPFRGTPEAAQAHARAALLQEPRVRIVLEAPGYLRAEARSRFFRFVDDVEVVVDGPAKLVRFRSASRIGRKDFGVNRARMERFGERFRALDAAAPAAE